MTLYTKSIHAKAELSDGIRICVMRFLKPWYKFDWWMPELAPEKDYLLAYKNNGITWEEYVSQYNRILEKAKETVKILSEIAVDHDITLLCSEKTPEKCHRRLIADECKKYNPHLEVILK